MRLARGDVHGAIAASDEVIEAARAIRDPQALVPGLVERAFVLAKTGDAAGVETALLELAEARSALALAGMWVTQLAFTLLELGREEELLAADEPLGVRTPWRDAALAVARGDLVAAADRLEALGAATFEAYPRLRGAGALSSGGRPADAQKQLAKALAFYRSVGATAFIREGEALLAAAS